MPKRPPAQAKVASSTRGLWRRNPVDPSLVADISPLENVPPNFHPRSPPALSPPAPVEAHAPNPRTRDQAQEDIVAPAQLWREHAVDETDVVDLDAIVADIDKLENVSLSRRRHFGLDWRKVMQLRLKSEVYDP